MGSGGGNTTSTVTQQNIPKEFFPYFDRLLAGAENEMGRPYQPYEGQRLTGQSGDTSASYGLIRDVSGRPAVGREFATDVAAENVSRTGQIISGAGPAGFNAYQFAPTETMTADVASEYMDPYLRSVVDLEKERAREDYEISRAGRSADAVGAGAFGGSRAQIAESMAERDLMNRMRDIEATGLKSAYGEATRRFEADRAARTERDLATATEAARVETARAAENRAAREEQLKMMNFSSEQATLIANLEEQARTGDIQAAQLLETIGKAQEARGQAGLDLAYEDYLRQQGFNKEQIGFMSGILQGLPIAKAGDTVQQTPYNPVQQALGAGLAGLSLYKGFQ